MNTTIHSDREPECIRYATIAPLTENEKIKYSSNKALRSIVVCQTCGVKFSRGIASKCPVCAINEKLAELQLGAFLADNGVVEVKTTHNNEKITTVVLHNYKYGDVIKFGKLGGVPIEWQVMQVKDNKLLVLAKEGIEARSYHSKSGSVTWETSTIRQYLNNEFYSKCFNVKEQRIIFTTDVENKDSAFTGISGGNDTEDRLFLLSSEEIEMMFNSNEARKCQVTEWAKNKGAYVDANTGTGWWWLRTPGEKDIYASYVATDGSIVKGGCYTGSSRGILRPAMWVDGNALDTGGAY